MDCCIINSMGIRYIIISTLDFEVFLVIVVVDLTANLSSVFRLFICCSVFMEFPHVMHAYSNFGLTTPVYAHFDSFGLGAYIPLRLLLIISISFLQLQFLLLYGASMKAFCLMLPLGI